MRFLFIGDSITVGMSPTLGRYMLSLGVESEIVSRISMTAEDAVTDELVISALRDRRPSCVVVLLGTNPIGRTDLERFRMSVRALRRLVYTYCDRLAWVSPWAGDDAVARLEILREEIGFRVANGSILAGDLQRAGENQVHFTSEAYVPLSWRVAEWSVRVADSRALTTPRSGAKIVSVLGLLGAAVVPLFVR